MMCLFRLMQLIAALDEARNRRDQTFSASHFSLKYKVPQLTIALLRIGRTLSRHAGQCAQSLIRRHGLAEMKPLVLITV
ncbi:hypothetical protein ROLI_003250 [Roseobacter fucihabitans]|uniref:Transposase DDE domain-containing protein n=1 Tax=Roseobacter fucihabitans TaxID=1537242 RepID=A0ABZ2BNY2_9RHOB|nr:hypothetical protein [Roseobacter litoralis]